jgi:hypothetical protein
LPLQAQDSAPVAEAAFRATVAPWLTQERRLADQVSFAGAATVGVEGGRNGLFDVLVGPLTLCDQNQSLIAEIKASGASGRVVALIRVGREREWVVEAPVLVGGKRPDELDSFVWIEKREGSVAGFARLTSQEMQLAYTSADGRTASGGRHAVVLEAEFRAAPLAERIRQAAGGREFDAMSPHERQPVIQRAMCDPTVSESAVPPPAPEPSASPPSVAPGARENHDRWYAQCLLESRAQPGSAQAKRTRCACMAKVLAESATYLQPQELQGLSREFWRTVDLVMRRGRRPAVYVQQASCG